jgi:hypothetical protein
LERIFLCQGPAEFRPEPFFLMEKAEIDLAPLDLRLASLRW